MIDNHINARVYNGGGGYRNSSNVNGNSSSNYDGLMMNKYSGEYSYINQNKHINTNMHTYNNKRENNINNINDKNIPTITLSIPTSTKLSILTITNILIKKTNKNLSYIFAIYRSTLLTHNQHAFNRTKAIFMMTNIINNHLQYVWAYAYNRVCKNIGRIRY